MTGAARESVAGFSFDVVTVRSSIHVPYFVPLNTISAVMDTDDTITHEACSE